MWSPFFFFIITFIILLFFNQPQYVKGALFSKLTAQNYREGQVIPLMVNSLSSQTNLMPMPWYSMPWCQLPEEFKKAKLNQNIGSVLWGEQIEPSLYRIEMLTNVSCALLCQSKTLSEAEKKLMAKRIEANYRGNMMLDGLPVVEEFLPINDLNSGGVVTIGNRLGKTVNIGFPLGVPKKQSGVGRTVVYNHLEFSIFFTEVESVMGVTDEDDLYHIVGFAVRPRSIDFTEKSCDENFNPSEDDSVSPVFATDNTITWTYSVKWYFTDEDWENRWDIYINATPLEKKIHWFSIINSMIVVIVLSGIIAIIMMRTLFRDFARYNDPETIQEDREESGWKLVHADVFRKPARAGLLAIYVGTGVQLLSMMLITILFCIMGFVSPWRRGYLLTGLILMFALLGFTNGYVTAVLAKFFKIRSWRIIFITAMFFPGQIFIGYLMLNFVHWGSHASSATPFGSMLTLMGLWTFVSLPLVLLGGSLGYRSKDIRIPVKVSSIARAIPPQPWYLKTFAVSFIPGFFPFGASFIECVFILSSVWQGRIYYMFGFLAMVFLMILITSAEATIVLIYIQLINLEYRWWWTSFLSAGSYGIWLFGYSVLYFFISLSIRTFWGTVLYFGYMMLISYFFFVMLGAFSFLATFAFIKMIFSSIKVD